MENLVDLTKSVHDICVQHPGMIEVMKLLGFEDITKPGMLNTAGRFMTIPKGASMKHIPMEKIIHTMAENGYGIMERE